MQRKQFQEKERLAEEKRLQFEYRRELKQQEIERLA
jgi:hypothetical protein